MKILIEASSLSQKSKTGVAYFSTQLIESMVKYARLKEVDQPAIHLLWLNFLHRSPNPTNTAFSYAKKEGRVDSPRFMPLRLYAKLVLLRVALPLTWKSYDWILFPNFYSWPAPRSRNKAIIIHDVCYLRHPEYIEEKNLRFLRRVASRSIKQADLIIVNSEFTKREVIELTSTDPAKILAIDIPPDDLRLAPKQSSSIDSLRSYGIHKPYILSVGTIEPRKNLSTLLHAYTKLKPSIRDNYSLVLAGKWGWKSDDDKVLVESLRGAGYDIITTGYVADEDISSLYRRASLFAHTSHYEGFGMPITESLFCGVPTIAVKIPAFLEVGGKDACWWVDSSVEDVAKGIAEVLEDKALQQNLITAGYKRIAEYSWEKTANSVLDTFNKKAKTL